ncbi:hypothetical protein Acr_12g0000810 [Actinidia rufa]|uniref:Uncharacterized protein n=1 Tax=Actinidia rufa TaxID=165716 RepID=A0A7J0FFR8_9ERIC|nr:hypothetical protein Acr_12g0000810 [Actinidia rufa]
MSNTKTGGSGKQSKSKGSSSQRSKGKKNESTNLDYDHTRFTGKVEEKFYNWVWVRNGAVIEREFNFLSFENFLFGYLEDFTNQGWLHLASFKAELILTLCQEFMANIKQKSVTEKGKKRLVSWVRGKKLKITPDTFAKVFGLPHVENPEFEFSDVGMPDLDAISRELLIGSMSFTGLLTELFKRHGIPIPIDLTRIEPEKPIDMYSFTRSEGQQKKRKDQFSHLKEYFGRHTTLLQEIKGMLIRMQAGDNDDDEEDD